MNTIARIALGCIAAVQLGCPLEEEEGGPPGVEPLATVRGQMNLDPSLTLGGPIRLALVWYPTTGAALDVPTHIATTALTYSGQFPDFTFGIYSIPEPGALAEVTDLDGRITQRGIGQLVAYEDGNGNDLLDTIPRGGDAIDRVLGASLGGLYEPSPDGFALFYSDVDARIEEYGNVPAGYSLWSASARAQVPMSTPVTLPLTGKSDLVLFVCEELFDPTQTPSGEGVCNP